MLHEKTAPATRLAAEATVLQALRHPGLVELLEVDHDRLRTVRISGPTLAAQPCSDADELAGVIGSVAATLADLHAAGFVHGALAADHILLADGRRPVLCSPGHPGRPVDDIAALGALLLAQLGAATGKPAGDIGTVLRRGRTAHLLRAGAGRWHGLRPEGEGSRPGLFTSPTPEAALRRLAARCLHDDPAQRPTATMVVTAIRDQIPTSHLPRHPGSGHPAATANGCQPGDGEPGSGASRERSSDSGRADPSGTPPGAGSADAVDPPPPAPPHTTAGCPPPGRSSVGPWPEQLGATTPAMVADRLQRRAHARPPEQPAGSSDAEAPEDADPRSSARSSVLRPGALVLIATVSGATSLALATAAWSGDGSAPRSSSRSDTGSEREVAMTPPNSSAANTRCPTVSGLRVDADGDGCPEAATYADGVLTAGRVRFAAGQPGDVAATADWTCTGTDALAVLRPATGQVWLFERWAAAGAEVQAIEVATIPGATGLDAADADTDGCPELVVTGPARRTTIARRSTPPSTAGRARP